jgi:adhesin transport system outer membrane protein
LGHALAPAWAVAVLLPLPAAAQPLALPAPLENPRAIAAEEDGFLAALAQRPAAGFAAQLARAADGLPAVGESREGLAAARAQRQQARSRLFPVAGLDVVAADTLARDFDRPSTQFESLVPRSRADVIGSASQLLADFGATSRRIRAGTAASEAAAADVERTRVEALLAMIGAWHEALAARGAASIADGHVARLARLADATATRFAGGIDSGGDVARARAAEAAARARAADFARRVAAADARLIELFGAVPADLARAPRPEAAAAPADRPELIAARAQAQSADAARAAAAADRLPRLDARVTGSAFDVARSGRPDYDVRAQFTLSTRFSTGGAEAARVAELAARARAADLATSRIAAQLAREQAAAEAEVAALDAALPGLTAAYLDSRRARDLFAERFRVSRGSLFDVLVAEREFFENALVLMDAEYRRDVAAWVLRARQGRLLELFPDTAP